MSGFHDVRQLKDIFRRVDADNSGLIDARELQNALATGGVVLSLAGAAQLIRLHDRAHNGKIDFDEFVDLNRFLSGAQALFQRHCDPRQQRLNKMQLRMALEEEGFAFLEPPALEAICQAFDPDKVSSYDLTVFYALLAFLKASRATFRGFDPHNTGRVTMTLNQFLYAVANTR